MFPSKPNAPVRGYFYFCDPGTPHYNEWHYFGSRNWHHNDGTPDPPFGELPNVRQSWRNGTFPTTKPDAKIVGTQACIENGQPDSPPVALIAGVDIRCWAKAPPWGGLAGGGDSAMGKAELGGLAGGGDAASFSRMGGLAGGGVGTFEVSRPIIAVNLDGGSPDPLTPGAENVLKFGNVWLPGDGVTLFWVAPNTAWATPTHNTIYEYHCEVWVDCGGAPPAGAFIELALENGSPGGVWNQAAIGEFIHDATLGGSGYWCKCSLSGFNAVSAGGPVRWTMALFPSFSGAFVSNPTSMYVQQEVSLLIKDIANF